MIKNDINVKTNIGDNMKKYYILTVLIILVIFSIYKTKEVQEVINVIDIKDNYVFNNYRIYFNTYNLNTSNFFKTFNYFNEKNYEFKVIRLYPYYNSMYEKLFHDKDFLYYSSNLKQIIANFVEEYKGVYYKNNFEINVNNIGIDSVIINTSFEYLNGFINEYKLIKYELVK
mgnify:CR=1 FL=1